MFQKAIVNADLKSESNRLCQASEALASNYNDRITSASTSRHHQQQSYQNHFSNNPKEEIKSQKTSRNSNFNSLYQHSQLHSTQEMQQNTTNNNNLNQRNGHQMSRSTTNPQLYQVPPPHNTAHPTQAPNLPQPTSSLSKSAFISDFNHVLVSNRNPANKQRTSSLRDGEFRSAHNISQDQQERETDEVVTMIKEEELENDLTGFKGSHLETLDSFERELPVELSFLIRQQAFCMARMNYLDRQIRELKDTKQCIQVPQASTTSINQSQHNNRLINATTSSAHIKNGNFIPSDDSGGEYSRATISDDDELSSLLDQIAKSVRPERNAIPSISSNQQQQQRASYSVMSNQPQQYAIINPNQLHHQAVPVFVMGSPIAVAHPSSISSTVPGVHFQPEPRYNQYYEDFYVRNNSSSSTMHRHNGVRSQFDSSISAIEQLVSQKEKRQVKSQLKSADNWLKMRSSGLCNMNDNIANNLDRGTTGGDVIGNATERNIQNSSSSAAMATENSNIVIEENDI